MWVYKEVVFVEVVVDGLECLFVIEGECVEMFLDLVVDLGCEGEMKFLFLSVHDTFGLRSVSI